MNRKTLAAIALATCGLAFSLPSQAHTTTRAQVHIDLSPIHLGFSNLHLHGPRAVRRHVHQPRCYRRHAPHSTHWSLNVRRSGHDKPHRHNRRATHQRRERAEHYHNHHRHDR